LQPGRFTVVDTESGGVVANLPCVLGVERPVVRSIAEAHLRARRRLYRRFPGEEPDHYTAVAHVPVGAGAAARALQSKTRTQDSYTCPGPTCFPRRLEVLLFYVND